MQKRGILAGAALAGALLAAAQAQAAPVTATIRVEGLGRGIIPQLTLQTDARAVTDDAGVPHALPGPRALGLLYDAAAVADIAVSCTWDPGFGDCYPLGIGGDTRPDGYWAFIYNDRYASLGAASQPVQDGDRVVFVAMPSFTASVPPLLELSLSGDRLAVGSSFTATVASFDVNTGVGTPAAGVRVVYGSQVAVTGDGGQATLFALPGTVSVAALQDGTVPVSGAPVCGYGDDPTTCRLPAKPTPTPAPTPAPTSPAPVVQAAADSVAPSSRVTAPRLFSISHRVTRVSGVVAPDRSDIAKVEFALARRVGTLCRFRQPSGRLGSAVGCSTPVWLPARGRAFWTANLHAPLAPGRYRVFARATDGAGNVERTMVTGASSGSFTVR